jgi:thymidine kinase
MKELIIWTGPVHSGKSTRALIRAERYRRLGHDVVLVRPTKSVRPELGEEPGMLVTKTKHKFPSIEVDSPSELLEASEGATVVWVDEPMLFPRLLDPQLVDVLHAIRETAVVLVSGLTATSELGVFGSAMPQLLALADEINHCKADCDFCGCLGVASRSVCTVPKDGEVLVGGESVYKAACPACWGKAA